MGLTLFGSTLAAQEKEIPFAFGNMDQWVIREIEESAVIGGNTKHLYEIAPGDTIKGNVPYHNLGGSPWATSNVMAKVAGVVKTNTSVFPERRGNGWCARLETRLEKVRVLGMLDIEVIAAGSVFLGMVHEPIKGTKNPQSMLACGVPFTKRPTAVRFDYKIKADPQKNRMRSTGFSKQTTVQGADSAAVFLLLQKRWEDKDGNIYAKRVGTMVHHFTNYTPDWVNNATYPIHYGNISSSSYFRPSCMRLQDENRHTLNSKGQSVPIHEVGWAEDNETPTHIILQFVSSNAEAYVGTPGNTFWIDNVRLVY